MREDELVTLEKLNTTFEKRRRRLDADTGQALADEISLERRRLKRLRKTTSMLANLTLALVLAALPLGRFIASDRSVLPLLLVGGAGIGAAVGLIYAEIGRARFTRNLLGFNRIIRGRGTAKPKANQTKKTAEPCTSPS